jgi:hypothetical protein
LAVNSVEAQIGQHVIDAWGAYPYSNLNYVGDKINKSSSFSLLPKYALRDDAYFRCEFSFTNIYLISHLNGVNDSNATASTQFLIKDDTLKQKIFRFAPGIQWNIIRTKLIQAYCGMSLNYSFYTESHWSDNLRSSDPNNLSYERWTGTTKGGYAGGLGAFGGFDFYPVSFLSIGAEFSSALVYYKMGGKQNGMHYAGPNAPTYPRAWSIANNEASGLQFLKIMPSFKIGIRF